MRGITRVACSAAICALLAVGTTVSALASSPQAADISHVVWFDLSKDPMTFTDSHVVLNRGVHAGGGCQFTLVQKRRLSEPRIGAQELGRDVISCVDVVREGHTAVTGQAPQSSTALAGLATRPRGGDPCANEDFTWYDPINVPLTEITTYGCFLYTGQYVGNCTNSSSYIWWNSNTGWHNNGPGTDWVSYNADDTQCFSNTNNSFTHYAGTGCWSGTTNIYYQPNKLVMYGNGSVGTGTSSWATGACTNQLHFHSNL